MGTESEGAEPGSQEKPEGGAAGPAGFKPVAAQASVSLGQAKGSCVPGNAGGTEPRPRPLQTTATAWGRSVVL